jgi:hypothetical protein
MRSAELTAAPIGAERHPWDWYVEESWVTDRLVDHVPFEQHVPILDPCAGLCTIPDALAHRGFMAAGTDLFRRTTSPYLLAGWWDFLAGRHPAERWAAVSIVTNPPFSCQNGRLVRGLAERFVRRALEVATHKVAVLLPLKWLASTGRHALFADRPPAIFVLSERPSMPPGDKIADLGDRAWSRGKIDYVWLVWDQHAPLAQSTVTWIPARPKAEAV